MRTRLHIEHCEHRVGQPEYDVVTLPDGKDLRQVEELLTQGVQKPPGQFDFADQVSAGDSGMPGLGDHLDHPVGLGQRVLVVLEPGAEGGVGHDSIIYGLAAGFWDGSGLATFVVSDGRIFACPGTEGLAMEGPSAREILPDLLGAHDTPMTHLRSDSSGSGCHHFDDAFQCQIPGFANCHFRPRSWTSALSD